MYSNGRAGGSLRHRISLQKRREEDDGYGNKVYYFVTQFDVPAEITPSRGTEDVIASRLQGITPVEIRVRNGPKTRLITTDWQIVNSRHTDEIYSIKSKYDPTGNEAWIVFVCQLGGVS